MLTKSWKYGTIIFKEGGAGKFLDASPLTNRFSCRKDDYNGIGNNHDANSWQGVGNLST